MIVVLDIASVGNIPFETQQTPLTTTTNNNNK